ncbi:MAG: DUF4349 domain-containing protein [Acetatifactor sp.]
MKKKVLNGLLAVLCVVSLAGCGSADSAAEFQSTKGAAMNDFAMDQAVTEEVYYSEAAESTGMLQDAGASPYQSPTVSVTERKLIKTVGLDVETKEYDSFMSQISSHISAYGGYIEASDSNNGSRYSSKQSARYANMTIRIPQEKLDDFLGEVTGICNVVRRNDSVNDVTLNYVDTESRRDALKVEQDRLLELLAQAQNLEEILIIEDRLTDVRYELQSSERQLRSMDDKVTFSTIRLSVSEVAELTEITPVAEKSDWEKITEGFMDNLKDVYRGFLNFIIWFLSSLPKLFVWAVVILIIVFIVKSRRKKRAAKKAAKEAELKAAYESQKEGSAKEE